MKKLSLLLITLLTAWTFQACNNTNQNGSVENAEEMNEDKAAVDGDNSEFLVKAASGGMMEVELGNMAQEKAQNQRVKDFGAMMVRDHSKANDELKMLAGTKNITIPSVMGEDHQKHVTDISQKSGAEFDEEYMSMMVDDHQEDIRLFEDATDDSNDPDIKAFAGKTLTVLRTHLDSAKAINDAVKNRNP